MVQYIAAGFFQDAESLLNEFVQGGSIDFPAFAEIWRKRNFPAIFMGRDKLEITPFTNEIFQIALRFLSQDAFNLKVGGVYLLYALYRNQICIPSIKIRITLAQFEIFKKIRIVAMENQCRTLHYVTDYLFDNSFNFVASSTTYGPKNAKSKVDYDSSTHDSSVIRDVKSGMTQFHASRALENLKDLNEKYSKLKQKVYPQNTSNHQSTVDSFNTFISQLENFVSRKPKFVKHKATSSKTESSIGSRRAELKAAAYLKRVYFQQLNNSDDEVDEPVDKTLTTVVRKPKEKLKIPRKIGRPKKSNIKDLIKSSENSASEIDSPRKSDKKASRKRIAFLDEDNLVPTLLQRKQKKQSAIASSESEEDSSEETDGQSNSFEEEDIFL